MGHTFLESLMTVLSFSMTLFLFYLFRRYNCQIHTLYLTTLWNMNISIDTAILLSHPRCRPTLDLSSVSCCVRKDTGRDPFVEIILMVCQVRYYSMKTSVRYFLFRYSVQIWLSSIWCSTWSWDQAWSWLAGHDQGSPVTTLQYSPGEVSWPDSCHVRYSHYSLSGWCLVTWPPSM